jgi:hypothetical protein
MIFTQGVARGTGQGLLMMAPQNVARLTGGQYTSLAVADQALGRLDDATRAGYILGYTPSNPLMDGRYRNVEVRVNRRDVEIQHRRGYTARPDTPPLELRELATSVRLSEAAATDYLPDDIKIKAEAAIHAGTSRQQQVLVSVTIDASRLTLVERNGRHEGSIALWILCGDAKQQVVGVLKQQMTLSMDATHYVRAMSSGVPYTTTVAVTGRPAHVKALVYDYAADMLGAVMVRVKAGR